MRVCRSESAVEERSEISATPHLLHKAGEGKIERCKLGLEEIEMNELKYFKNKVQVKFRPRSTGKAGGGAERTTSTLPRQGEEETVFLAMGSPLFIIS